MKKMLIIAATVTVLAILLSACGTTVTDVRENSGTVSTGASEIESVSAVPNDDPTDDSLAATGDFTVTPTDGVTVEGTTYTVSAAGEYTFSGSLAEGNIVVDAGDGDEVTLILNGASVTSSETAPILVKGADKVNVKSADGTYNTVTDNRDASSGDTDADGDAAIWSGCDLKINGKGTLIVTSSFDNGIKSKDDVTVKNVTLKVTSPGVALKGNDSVTVESGSLILTSTGSDGIKTSNSDISSKGNQRGTVTISGGSVDIYSACDGISAAYDVVIDEATAETALNISTADYAEQTGDNLSRNELYLIVPSSLYSDTTGYYGYFYTADEEYTGEWIEFKYDSMVYGGRAAYYGLVAEVPDGYGNVAFAAFSSGEVPDGDTAVPDGQTVNSSMNGFLVGSVDGGEISGDWVNLSDGGSGGSSKTTWSSKGIKAENSVTVSAGAVTVRAMDDGVHANADGELENGSSPLGTVTVVGGSVTVTAADDGLHADGKLTISGGAVCVAQSHEGLEANVISIEGGDVTVTGEDDGINAFKGASTPLVSISGGTLCVTTPSGDTDAIDSNGSVSISGGFVLVRGGASSGGMAGSVDVDGSITVTGGTVVAFGGICEIPSGDSVNVYVSNGKSFAAGQYVLTDADGATVASFTLGSSYNSLWIASEKLELNGEYSLTCGGSEVLSWTQSSATAGDSVSGGFGGFGGFGGPGGRR